MEPDNPDGVKPLPDELVVKIIQHLPLLKRLEVELVPNLRFRDLAANHGWTDVQRVDVHELAPVARQFDVNTLAGVLDRCGNYLNTLDLSRFLDAEAVIDLLKRCPHLSEVTFGCRWASEAHTIVNYLRERCSRLRYIVVYTVCL